MNPKNKTVNPENIQPYDWALKQLRIKEAHKITRGSKDVVVAVIDLGYNHHPDMDGHLWNNPNPIKGDRHGWDFVDDDASLEYSGSFMSAYDYCFGHHVFVAAEVAAVAPECPVMIVRVGYSAPDSWVKGIRYAVDNGAKVLVIPHGYLNGEMKNGIALFYQGTDFSYPCDNQELRQAYDYAYDRGCLIVQGSADNRGRRVAYAISDTVLSVGSTNRKDEPANICCNCDYTEVGAPGGERDSDDIMDFVWGCGPDSNYIPFTGGCMASGFGGGVAALIWSKFPTLTNDQIKQILRNTTRRANEVAQNSDGWEPKLGYGIIDASKAVSIKKEQLCRDIRLDAESVKLIKVNGVFLIKARVYNTGIWDAQKAMIVTYNGDPQKAVVFNATRENPQLLVTRQIGHTITPVRGFHTSEITIELVENPGDKIWVETFCLDRSDLGNVSNILIELD